MSDVTGASPGPALTPVETRGRGPSAPVALGVLAAALVALVGISLVEQSGRGPGPEAAGNPANAAATTAPSTSPTAPPAATSSPALPQLPPAGTPPARVAVAVGPAPRCPPGSTPDAPGPADQARPPAGPMAFDRGSGRIVLVADAGDGDAETWTLDVCTNTWTRMHPDQQPPGAGKLVYDIDSDLTVAIDGANGVWAYDLDADTWTEKGSSPFTSRGETFRFYDPVSGHVVATVGDDDPDTADAELWSYEVETDSWTPIRQVNRLTITPREYVYDASVDRIVAYAPTGGRFDGASTWLFDLRSGTWSGTGAVTPEFPYGSGWFGPPPPATAYDEAAERTVMAGQGRSIAYDATTDRWETLFDVDLVDQPPDPCGMRPECRPAGMVYDAVNGRLVVYGGEVYAGCTLDAPRDMLALDLPTGSWTSIVPPVPLPPPLRDLAAEETPAGAPDRSPWIRAATVTLHGGPFFTRVPGVADEPWSSTPPAAPATVVDGLFLAECQLWTEGTVWWEEQASDPLSPAWIEIDLGGTFVIDAAVVQADVNDEYRLSYRDPATAEWAPLWAVPLGEAGGMATRPRQGDASVRWPIAPPVVTDALRFEAMSGDAQYSVSEIAVFGVPAP